MGAKPSFARPPYLATRPVPPGYVGPAWAAPGPHVHLPPKQNSGPGCGCAVVLLVGVLGLGVATVGVFLAGMVWLASASRGAETTGVDAGVSPRDDGDDLVDAGIPEKGRLPDGKLDPREMDAVAEKAWTMGACSDAQKLTSDAELRDAYETSFRGRGSAKRMRGNVAVVNVLLSSSSLPWTMRRSRDAHRAALLTARYFESESKKAGVADLRFQPLAWTIATDLTLPDLPVDAQKRVADGAAIRLLRTALRSLERAFGRTLASVVQSLRADGYDNVAFVFFVPKAVNARDFAIPVPIVDGVDQDVAFVFEEARLDRLGFVAAHETAHLFGADDLYPIRRTATEDENDLMRAACHGYSGMVVRDTTAWAIGWTETRPRRPYRFGR